MDIVSLALSRGYTDETVIGGGAIKGKNCTISSITEITGGHRITFLWTLDDGTEKSSTLDVMDGQDGQDGQQGETGETGNGISSITSSGNVITINYTNGQSVDITIPTVPANAINDLSDVNINTTTLADGDVLKYDVLTDTWVNGEGGGGDSELSVAVTSNTTVGAITSGTTLSAGTTFTEFVQKLLISEIAPTVSFSISKSGNVVYGESYTETLTVNVSNMGTAKKIKTIAWYEGSTLKQTDTIDSTITGSWTYTMSNATTDTTTFKAIVTYTKSDDTDTSTTKTSSINFYYNKFRGVVDSLTPSEATVESLTSSIATSKGGTYSFTASAQRIAYAYPSSLGALTSIKDGNGFSLFDSFTRTTETYTQNGTSVSYYLYVLTDATTVSGYSVVFA